MTDPSNAGVLQSLSESWRRRDEQQPSPQRTEPPVSEPVERPAVEPDEGPDQVTSTPTAAEETAEKPSRHTGRRGRTTDPR